jgi:hypothetical protein
MNIESLRISSTTQRKDYTGDEVIAALDGGASRPGARTTMTASYRTDTFSPTVYYTALYPDGTVLTGRTTTGVELSPCGDYTYVETVTGVDQFIAVWDEGNADDFRLERIMVDT